MSRYTSKHTGSEIDAAIDRAKAGGTIDTLLTGKAPAGYGLGGSYGGYIADADNATVDGKYRTNSGTLNLPDGVDGMFGVIDVTTIRPDKALLQKFCPGTSGYQPYSLERRCISGVWQPWEWVNPPMQIGVEYRTTERYMGKPVYVKLVDFGALPNATQKMLEHGIQNISAPFSIEGHITSSSRNAVGSSDIWWSFTASKIIAGTTKDMSTRNAYVKIKYTKTTD